MRIPLLENTGQEQRIPVGGDASSHRSVQHFR